MTVVAVTVVAVILLAVMALLAWAVFAFNRLVRLRNQVRTAWPTSTCS